MRRRGGEGRRRERSAERVRDILDRRKRFRVGIVRCMAEVEGSSMQKSAQEILAERIASPSRGWMLAETTLSHFALINYAFPPERLRPHIPNDRFDIPTFQIGGKPMAMLSAVPFWDFDFRFRHIFPFVKLGFGQTNHRAYLIDRKTGEHVVWFFGTTLGSPVVAFPNLVWGLPWHYARYKLECDYNADEGRYNRYEQWIESKWCSGRVSLTDTGKPVSALEGFALEGFPDAVAMKLILTHPIEGYFYRRDGRVGTYAVRHPEMKLTLGESNETYFSLYERLGILSREEMAKPHSVMICHEIPFEVLLPPRLETSGPAKR